MAQNTEQDRRAVIAEAMRLLWAACAPAALEPDELKRRFQAWQIGLDEIPTEEIPAAAAAVIQRRTSKDFGLPTPGELVAAWQGDEHDGPANAGAYASWDRRNDIAPAPRGPCSVEELQAARLQRRRWGMGLIAVTCLCKNQYDLATPAIIAPGGTTWVCAAGVCGWTWPVADTTNAPSRGVPGPLAAVVAAVVDAPAAVAPPRDDAKAARLLMLKNALDTRCLLDTDKIAPPVWQEFGAWLAAKFDVGEWDNDLARTQWGLWQSEQTQAAAAAGGQPCR